MARGDEGPDEASAGESIVLDPAVGDGHAAYRDDEAHPVDSGDRPAPRGTPAGAAAAFGGYHGWSVNGSSSSGSTTVRRTVAAGLNVKLVSGNGPGMVLDEWNSTVGCQVSIVAAATFIRHFLQVRDLDVDKLAKSLLLVRAPLPTRPPSWAR